MTLKALTDFELHAVNVDLAEKQRRITLEQLNHLNETESRRLFAKFSCDGLHAYCVKELKLDEGTAGRYISAARLLREVPEVHERIVRGTTCMTSLAQAGVFFRREERAGQPFDTDDKKVLLKDLDQKSTREVERILVTKASNPEIHFKERVTAKTEKITEIKIHVDQETLESLERLKEIWSHAMPHANFADVIKRALKDAVERTDPVKKAERSKERVEKKTKAKTAAPNSMKFESVTPAPESKEAARESKHDPTSKPQSKRQTQREVWIRDKGECTFVDPGTGEICASKHFVEEDHIIPKAMGGEYSRDNIRLRCRAHNQRHAVESYGQQKMNAFLN